MSPTTRAEATQYLETSRHADVMAFLRTLMGLGDSRLHLTSFGTSPLGKDLPLVVASARGVRTPAEAHALGLPVVMVMSGIHAGEVEGKEACLMLLRDIVATPAWGELLEKLTLVVMPLFNPDGNDAIDPGNRALALPKLTGQMGPVGVGTRTTSQNINLNRDYLKAAAPEMRAWMAAWHAWRPDLTIDNHSTNGSVHRFHMTYDVPHVAATAPKEPIVYMREVLTPAVAKAVSAHGFHSGWYGNFVEDEQVLDAGGEANPHSQVKLGWVTYPHHPRFGANYRGLFGGLDLLLEAYSYIPFRERVGVAYAWMLESLRFVARNGAAVRAAVAEGAQPPSEVAIRSKMSSNGNVLTILTRTPRTFDGVPSEVLVQHIAAFSAEKSVRRPTSYVVPESVATHLTLLGLRVEPGEGQLSVEVPIVTGFGSTAGRSILEAASTGDVQVRWEKRVASANGLWRVPTAQRGGALAVYLCEPESDDNAFESGLLVAPPIGEALPLWRVV
jgi:hypothetical protein